MFGCARLAIARASRSKRAGSACRPSSLIATRRSSSRSRAAQTSAIPPTPIRSSRRYRPPMTSRATAVAYAVVVADLLSMHEAQRLILERARPLPSERVPLAEASGRVLAQEALALVDLPPFPSSAMDGFALRAADSPGELSVVFRIAAGRPAPRPLDAGEAMAIATGGVVPERADAVIPLEDVGEHDNNVVVSASVS